VLVDYGTGAVMGVPAHDQRDYLYASKFDLPIRTVVKPDPSQAVDLPYLETGVLVESGPFTGMNSEPAKKAIADELERIGHGCLRTTYRMRDWLISRQRYWGAPIPIIHCAACGPVPVPVDELPVLLPDNVEFTGRGASPLAQSHEFVDVSCPRCQGPARRETDTMDTFVDSSWYYLRFAAGPNPDRPFDKADADYWMPVDEYVGGKEHAILHLLYSRFFTKVLHDAGWLDVKEPFTSLLSQGMVVYGGAKMSKSKGNSLSPESILADWGTDATRVFMMFAAPPEKDFEWSQQGVEGSYRFLQRVFRLAARNRSEGSDPDAVARLARVRARTVKKVTEDLGDRRAFNTAVSALMEYTNALYQDLQSVPRAMQQELLEALALMLAPMAPHLAEELWMRLGHQESVHTVNWPDYDPGALIEEEVEIAVQVNGKVRGRLTIGIDWDQSRIEAAALAHSAVQPYVADGSIKKVVVIPSRLVNVVVA
jgi:leucyl-tRNA synthetase